MTLYTAHVLGVWTVGPLCLFGGTRLQDAALVVIANWIAAHLLVWGLGEYSPWAGYLAIDGISMAALALWMTAADALLDQLGLMALVLLYAAQSVTHVGFVLLPVDAGDYWVVLAWLALVQVAALAGWLVCDIAGKWRHAG